jgi:hypothetical protein
MPDVKSINLSDGIRIEGHSRTVQINAGNIVVLPDNLKTKEDRLNQWLQEQYESRHLLADYEPGHRVRQDPPVLHDWERIEGDELVVTTMYVQAHIFTLSPLKLTLHCQNKEVGPITGEWW